MKNSSQHLGKYQILEQLGKGGFATVFRARDPDLDREVALKVLDPLLMRDPVWVQRFRQEAKAIARLKHPRIITIHEIGQSEGVLYIATELVEGGSLADRIAKEGRIIWEETVQLVGEIADALGYAHSQGVLHRDMKPANVLLDPSTGAILTDFGFARIVADHSLSVSMSGGVVGTPAYIAPEVWHGDKATAQTDVYALGCILYEMVTGQELFTGATPPAVMLAHFQPPALPDTWPDDVPPGLTEVLDKTLAREPEQRYATAGELAEALAALNIDRLAEPYADLEQAIANEDWQAALALVDEIKATDADYRDVAALEQKALAGKEEAAKRQQIATLHERAEQALAAGQWQNALAVVDELKAADPESEDVALLEKKALVGIETDARKQQAVQWQEAVETALAAGNLEAAELALAQWEGLGIEDGRIKAFRERIQDERTAAVWLQEKKEREKQEKAEQARLAAVKPVKQPVKKEKTPTKTQQPPAVIKQPPERKPSPKPASRKIFSESERGKSKETTDSMKEDPEQKSSGCKTISILVLLLIFLSVVTIIGSWQGYEVQRTKAYATARKVNLDRYYVRYTAEAMATATSVAHVNATKTVDAKSATAAHNEVVEVRATATAGEKLKQITKTSQARQTATAKVIKATANSVGATATYKAVSTATMEVLRTVAAIERANQQATMTATAKVRKTATKRASALATARAPQVVANRSANLRSGPGTDYSIVESVQKDERLAVIGKTKDSAWLLVRLDNGKSAWLYSSLGEVTGTVATLSDSAIPARIGPWTGNYYANKTLEGQPVMERVDGKLDFLWGYDSPSQGVPGEFSVRWTGSVFLPRDEVFCVIRDDFARIWVDSVKVYDIWSYDGGGRGKFTIKSGTHNVRIDFADDGGAASFRFGPCNDSMFK